MIVLGISALDKDSHATLMVDDKIVAAIGEERLTRVKMQHGFPHQAIVECLRIAGISMREVDHVAYPFWDWAGERDAILERARTEIPSVGMDALRRCHDLVERARREGPYDTRGKSLETDGYEEYMQKPWSRRKLYEASAGNLLGDIATDKTLAAQWVADAIRQHRKDHDELERCLDNLGLKSKLIRVEHHVAHQSNAFYASGYERALVVTIDAYGSGLSGSIAVGDLENGVRRLAAFDFPHSLGFFYEHLTSALGFKPSRHEGKILGLAAYGDPTILHDAVKARFHVENGNFKYYGANNYFFPRYLSLHFRKKDIAAAYQKVLEEVVAEMVAHHLQQTGATNIVLSGGVTANVKLNQRVAEVPGVTGVWVHPAMGDAGTGTGAAMHVLREKLGKAFAPPRMEHAYLGPGYSPEEVRKALQANNLTWTEPADLAMEVAKLIHGGRVVARCDGRMEYGPRALGNRSVMYHAREPQVNKWLNKQLARTEFMPFAPVTLWEDRHRYYKNIDVSEPAANFMTITVDCTDEMIRDCPAAVHVDNTARPQLVKRETNQGYYDILSAYKQLSGVGSLINTSFNMHEEPIVCSPEDAIRAFRLGHLDNLCIGPCLVENPDRVDRAKA
jgi:carbamoyltransferase